MKRSKLKPTLEETFAIGKLEGQKEAFKELLDMTQNEGLNTPGAIQTYIKARLKSIYTQSINNPFNKEG